ncbi:MAG: FHA domain-containing protein [Anaerolineae bacterium]
MIVCSNCKHTNIAGALFCSECGTPLAGSDPLTTQNIKTGQMQDVLKDKAMPPSVAPAGTINNWVTLHLLDTGQVLPLSERNEFTLGRISDGQPIMPDIDLSPYQAYARGVSRLHAVLKREASRVFLMDLGSSNGTFVNGKRLPPNTDHAISNGDVVALGKLKIQILLKAH